jgi:hypothetical protein
MVRIAAPPPGPSSCARSAGLRGARTRATEALLARALEARDEAVRQNGYFKHRRVLERLFFHTDGRPVRVMRRILFHSNGKPRGVFRKRVLRAAAKPARPCTAGLPVNPTSSCHEPSGLRPRTRSGVAVRPPGFPTRRAEREQAVKRFQTTIILKKQGDPHPL